MRKFAKTSTALLVTGAGAAFAAGTGTGFSDARAYVKLGFDNNLKPSSEAHYGFTLNMDSRLSSVQSSAPTAEMLFDRKGFLSAWLNGLPVAHSVSLTQNDGSEGPRFTAIDWSLIAAGAAGIGYGVYEVVDQKDTRDKAAAGGSAPAGTPAACPTGTTGRPPACVPTAAPSCPTGQVGTPPLCAPGPGLTAGTAALADDAVMRESASWLDEGTGQMGDLAFVKK